MTLIEHRRAPLVVGLVCVALVLPSLAGGFFSDDYAILAALEKHYLGPPWWDLYRFTPARQEDLLALRGMGAFPWWVSPELHLHLVRPLASVIATVDHALFGHSPVPYHLHSLLWFAALLASVHAFFARVLPRRTATLALFLYGTAQAVCMPAGWIAARHGSIATTAATLGLVALLASEKRPALRWLTALGMLVSLATAESGLGGLALWFAYELRGPRAAGARSRLLRSTAPVAIGLAYLALYAAAGGGMRGSDGYLDPMSAPVQFLHAAMLRVPALLGNAALTVPSELSAGPAPGVVAVIGVGGVVLVGTLLVRAWPRLDDGERALLRWAPLGALLAVFGCAGGFPGSRELLLANLAFAPLLAVLILRGFERGTSLGRRVLTGFLVFVHVIAAPLVIVALTLNNAKAARSAERFAELAMNAGGAANRYVVVSASDPMVAVYPSFVLVAMHPERLDCWTDLSTTRATIRVTRSGPSSITLEPEGSSFLRGSFETLYRAHRFPFHAGDEIAQCGAVVRVDAVDDEGRPTKIDVRYDAPLEDPSRVFLAWRNGEFVKLTPAEITAGLEIPWTPGPLGIF